ncbi:MAK10-like protein, partial [Tanacetum coccineum]
ANKVSMMIEQWSERRLFELARLLTSVFVRNSISTFQSLVFSLSGVRNLNERLLLEERDIPSTPQEGLFETPSFDEVDIQALAHVVELTRKGAVDSLKFAKGDLFHAFQDNTLRLKQENGGKFSIYRSSGRDTTLYVEATVWERARLHLFQYSLRDQASNWLERLPAGSITIWEDLTTRFLAQFFPPGRTAKLRKDILMYQQHHGESLSKAWTRFKDLLQKSLIMASTFGSKFKFFMTMSIPSQDEPLTNRWNDPRDFAKPVKAIALPQDVPSTFDRRLIELKNQVQRLMEAHPALTQPTQVNKITTSCEICNGPYDTHYCMEDPEQAFVEYASSCTYKAGDARLSKFKANFKQQQSEITNKIDTVLKAITDQIAGTLPSDIIKNPKLSTYPVLSARSYPTKDQQCSTQTNEEDNLENIHVDPPTPPDLSVRFITEKVLKFNSFFESLELVPPSSNTELIYTKEEDDDVMFIEIISKDDNSCKEEPKAEGQEVEYFNIFPTKRIAEDVLVEVAEHVYPIDFVILNIKENEKRPFILGTPFLTTAKAAIKFDTITLRSGKSKISFHRIPESPCITEKGVKKDIEPIAPTMIVNRLVLEWEEKIKLHLEREMEFNQ